MNDKDSAGTGPIRIALARQLTTATPGTMLPVEDTGTSSETESRGTSSEYVDVGKPGQSLQSLTAAVHSNTGESDQRTRPKMKIFQVKVDGTEEPVATINPPDETAEALMHSKLSDLRGKLAKHLEFDYGFCLKDRSVVPDDMLVQDYLSETNKVAGEPLLPPEQPTLANSSFDVLYLKEKPQAAPVIPKILPTDALKKSFMITFVEKADSNVNEGSLQSTDLPISNTPLYLSQIRPFIKNMSASSDKHEFCLENGTGVSDSMKLETYVSKGATPLDMDSDLPTLTIFYRKVSGKTILPGLSDEMKAKTQVEIQPSLAFAAATEKPVTVEGMRAKAEDFSKLGISQDYLTQIGSVAASTYLTAGELDEIQWSLVVSNCNLMYGWKFDLNKMSVKRAPHPAFRLRKGLNIELDTSLSTNMPEETTLVQVPPSNSSIGSGLKVDDKSKLSTTATPLLTIGTEVASVPSSVTSNPAAASVDKADVNGRKTLESSTKLLRKKPNAIPSFTVTDESQVNISVVSSQLQESMAKNNFTADSFEIGGSASIKGVDINASKGSASRTDSGSGTSSTKMQKLMIANFRFPRATLNLRPEDLEPTEELKAAIDLVRRTKSLNHLRALHDRFGHLFCEEVLIGGRLQTTRVTTASDEMSQTTEKSQFKNEVGLSIAFPKVASLSMKKSNETGSDEQHSRQQTSMNDAMVFEATGGNTILATDPPKWCESVLDYRNWRVIERAGLTPIADIIAKCHSQEVSGVREWFVQAVPALSKFLVIPETRIVDVRLKLMSTVPGLTQLQQMEQKKAVCNYLGHQYSKPIHPIRTGLVEIKGASSPATRRVEDKGPEWPLPMLPLPMLLPGGMVTEDITTVYRETQYTEEIALFTPAQAQAPVILQYDNADNATEISANHHSETVWNMIVPYGEYLSHNSLVMLKSSSSEDDLWLTIYRNGQGHFMPGMTTSGEASFWRMTKDNKNNGNSSGTLIREGDTVKLCWRFSDQTAGFRDFYDDTFGRRTYSKPQGTDDQLYMKLPFPGFQKTTKTDAKESDGSAMIMSNMQTSAPFLQKLLINSKTTESPGKETTYNLFDTNFRIDLVGNSCRGELDDYMTLGLDQSTTATIEKLLKETRDTRQVVQNAATNDRAVRAMDDVGSAIFGPVFPIITAPAKAIVSGVLGFFGSMF
ncbi:hypothetical protein MMC19_000900 [Ptychographa xylographoides]|nr:hypothetical protein [Ptychographa xylographoides]